MLCKQFADITESCYLALRWKCSNLI